MSSHETSNAGASGLATHSPAEVAVRRFEGGSEALAVFEFEGAIRDEIIANLQAGYLAHGSYSPDARAVSAQSVKSLAVAGTAAGAATASTALSSTLFMATANPATLMQLGGGVGSSVMGVGGITAQAAFIPVASALPVVAPMLAIQALSTAVILHEFKRIDGKLDAIKGTLDTVLARFEATYTGQLLAASSIIDEVHAQYGLQGFFSNDMLARLAIAERDVLQLAERFRHLALAGVVGAIDDPAAVQRANYDAHSAMLASFLSLRVAQLRLSVDLQENPSSVESSVTRLRGRIKDEAALWEQLLQRSETLREEIAEQEAKLEDMNVIERRWPSFAGGRGAAAEREIDALKAAYTSTLESEKAITRGFTSLIDTAHQTLDVLEQPEHNREGAPVLVYWRDGAGEHSFTTNKLQLN
ncbi:MAG TPA: hypothetical protein H9830_06605 [Candidatus Agrococcus pullicola]|uniref:Uncharacterized protein n=1 Tax=Candidatus Agrococcus pullicola TaxID=2838429 RepID=A0A9D1YUW9_9MICO|nr:hypothetical protein [Candidatus Agrococcus pullicola]